MVHAEVELSGLSCSASRHDTARHDTARHGVARHGAARHDAPLLLNY